MEAHGDLRSGEDGTQGSAGFQQLSPVTRTPAQVVRAPWGRGPLIVGCRCPAGVRGWRGHSLGERGCPRPERSPGRARGLEAQAPIASPGSYMGPGPARPAPGSPHVNALWGHLGQEAADFFTEKGVRALGDCGRGGHTPFLWCFSTDERVEAAGSNKLCHRGAGRGSFRQSRALSRPGGAQA